jgi:hypothetical protein
MPNFLVIGAGKAGTTSLYHYLKQHPQIYISPVKEPNFFAFEGKKLNFRGPDAKNEIKRIITNIEDYRALFRGVSNEKAIGEISPRYLSHPEAPERIRRYVPDAKLIAVLRDPVERAYSSYLMWVRDGFEPCSSFSEAIQDEKRRIENNWAGGAYIYPGFYHEQLKRYFSIFNRNQIKIYLYEDFKTDPLYVLRDISRFLDVDDAFVPDISIKHNVSGIAKSKAWDLLLRPNRLKNSLKAALPHSLHERIVIRVMSIKNRKLVKPPLSSEIRRELISVYRDDILNLQDLIQRDLSKWLE